MNIKNTIIVLALLIVGGSLGLFLRGDTIIQTGSVLRTGEYQATTTGDLITFPASYLFSDTSATLGSVVITGANTGRMTFYNATTTNTTLRANKATTTLIIADIPASTAAGTYTFDIIAPDGLLIETTGSLPTSTITWR